MHELDHLMWEELRLKEGERRFAELTGVTQPSVAGIPTQARITVCYP
jgi:hypothetical protein